MQSKANTSLWHQNHKFLSAFCSNYMVCVGLWEDGQAHSVCFPENSSHTRKVVRCVHTPSPHALSFTPNVEQNQVQRAGTTRGPDLTL